MLMIIIGQDNNKIPNYMYGQLIEADEIGIETMALQSQKDKKKNTLLASFLTITLLMHPTGSC